MSGATLHSLANPAAIAAAEQVRRLDLQARMIAASQVAARIEQLSAATDLADQVWAMRAHLPPGVAEICRQSAARSRGEATRLAAHHREERF